MTSIGSLSYAITADTSQLNQSVTLTRQEMRTLRRVIEETKSPAERLQGDLNQLNRLFDAGKLSAEQYAAATRKARDGMRQPSQLGSIASGAAGSLPGAGMVGSLVSAGAAAGPAGLAIAGGLAVATAAIGGTAFALHQMNAGMRETDTITDAAQKLNMSFRDLNTSRLSLAQTSGLDTGTIDKSLQRMQLGLAEANTTKQGGVHDAMQALGLDAGELLKKGPLEALKEISAATQKLENPTDQLVVAYELFGKNGAALVTSLREGPEKIERMAKLADDLGMNLTQAQAAGVGAANDAWEEMGMIATGFFRQVGAEFAPVMEVIFSSVTDTARGFKGWTDYLPPIIDGAVTFAGTLWDTYEVVTLTHTVLNKIAHLDFSGVGTAVANAADFGTGARNVEAIQAARARAAAEAASKKTGANENDSVLEQLERRRELEKEADATRKDADATRKKEELDAAKEIEDERKRQIREREQLEKKIHDHNVSAAEELNKKYTENFEVSRRLAELDELQKNGLIDDNQRGNFRDKILTEAAKKESTRSELGPSATKGSAEEYNLRRESENKKLDQQLVELQKQSIAQAATKDVLVDIRKAIETQKVMLFR